MLTGKFEALSLRYRALYFLAALPMLFMQPVTTEAGSMIIGHNASVATGSGKIEPGCNDAEIAGALAGSVDGAVIPPKTIRLGIAIVGVAVRSSLQRKARKGQA